MRWRVLGPLEVWAAEGWTGVDVPKRRAVLAALLAEPGRIVPAARLVDELWEDDPPPAARKLVSGYVLKLRRLLGDPGGQILVTQAPGYRLVADRAEVDAGRFEELVAQGRAALADDDAERAGDLLATALALWRGPALVDVPRGPLAAAEADRLEETRLSAVELRIEAGLRQGQGTELVPELRRLTTAHPLRERFWHLLIRALAGASRQAEALTAYERARQVIAGELGTDPGPDLQRLHQCLLAGGQPEPTHPGDGRTDDGRSSVAPCTAVIPRQLPGTVRHFTGREAELRQLWQLMDELSDAGGAVVVSAIGGTAGVGKTALAVHWAHQAADRFPDGQLYVNLHGYDPGQPMPAGDALVAFLHALGVPSRDIPAGTDERAAGYRSLLAGRRMLIVLDNAGSVQQVRPLLPGTAACVTVVTSRDSLAGLAARDGARLLSLDVLSHGEAVQMLTARFGAARAAAEPVAVAEIAELCARLPLALAVAAARAETCPGFRLAALAAELRGTPGRLDALDAGEPAASVRAVFSWSYQQLSPGTARMFRLLGLHPGPDISIPAAASLAATGLPDAQGALRELTRAHLISEHAPGRYAFHDLLRAYAADQGRRCDSKAERDEAISRVLDHYLHTAAHSSGLLHPEREPVTLLPPRAGTAPEQPASHRQAMAWFEAEYRVLLAAVARATESGLGHAWQLPWAMAQFQVMRAHYQEWAATQRAALAAATRLGDTAGRAVSSRFLATAHLNLGDYDQALGYYSASLELYRQLGNCAGEARAQDGLSCLAERQGRYADALAHAEQALRLYQAIGYKAGEAAALNSVGWSHGILGDYERARVFCQQALACNEETGDRWLEGNIRDSLGYVEHHLSNFGEAAACYRRALAIFRELGDHFYEADTLAHLGDTHQAAGELTLAQEAWQKALAILEDVQHPDAEQVRAKLASTNDHASQDPTA